MHRLHKHMPSRAAKNRITNIAGVFLLLVATLHLARAIAGWEATIAGWTIPIWFSWVATLVAILLARAMFQMDKE